MDPRKPGVARHRFAPSPTGPIHLGTARTALVAWLAARASGGVFLLRVEDLDTPRVRAGAEAELLEDLRWLGLDWDEGPDVGGPLGPYRQSERRERYDAAIATLTRDGHLFRCTCSRREIESVASAPHGDEGPRYPGTCRERPSHPERPSALRFPFDRAEPFVDGILGPIGALPAGDFVVQRADGMHAYQLAVTVDDLAMGVTHVVRGDDLLASTPRQIAITRALGHAPLAYAHAPLVRGEDGVRLAKRHGAPPIRALRERGVAPEAIIGQLAASLSLASERAPRTARSLVEHFSLERVRERGGLAAWTRAS